MSADTDRARDTTQRLFSLAEVARHLDITPENLQRLRRRFAHFLGPDAAGPTPAFTSTDIAALVTVQKLLAQGYDNAQIDEHGAFADSLRSF